MDRLVAALDDLLDRGEITEPVLIQSPCFSLRPRLAKALDVLPFREYTTLLREARVVITHGGPGTIMSVIALGKAPIVVPRDPAFGEHVDGHQIQFCEWLAKRRSLQVVRDLSALGALLEMDNGKPGELQVAGPAPDVLARLVAMIEATGRS